MTHPAEAGPVARFVALLTPSTLAAAAVFLLAASALPFDRVKAYADSLTADGNAETITPGLLASMALAARVAGVVFVIAAATLFRVRKGMARAIAERGGETADFIRETWAAGVDVLRRERPAHLVALAGIVIAGVALRVAALHQPINYDESFTYITYASRPWLVAWADYSYPNNHLLHTLLVHLAIGVFGHQLWAVRLPAFAAGCLAIPLAYAVARRLSDRDTALLTAALVATTQLLVVFSVCARGYTMIVVLFLLMLLCAADVIAGGSRRAWPALTILGVAGLFTVPTFLYPLGVVMGWVVLAGLAQPENSAARLPVVVGYSLIITAIAILCYAPPLASSGLYFARHYATGGVSMGAFVPQAVAQLAEVWGGFTRGMPASFAIAMVASGVLGAGLLRRREATTLLAALVLWPVGMVLLQRLVPPSRVLLFALPVVLMFCAAGATCVAGRLGARLAGASAGFSGTAAVALAGVLCLCAWVWRPAHYTETNGPTEVHAFSDLEQVALYLKETLQPGDALVSSMPLDYPLEYYLRIHDVPTGFLRRAPAEPARLVVVANETIQEPVAKVLVAKALDPKRTGTPRLLRAFVYSAVYDVPFSAVRPR